MHLDGAIGVDFPNRPVRCPFGIDRLFTAVSYHGLRLVVRKNSHISFPNDPILMSNSPFQSLTNEADWTDAWSRSEEQPVLLFKHSAACPVSGSADQEMHALAENEDLPVYKLVVQESRALSDEIADTLGVQHETPQAILLENREPVFNASHFDVTTETLREALRSVSLSAE